jgi:serine-type D-Ala-D-Ala carboxypeptidase (penicillin-binding protein 5/6)
MRAQARFVGRIASAAAVLLVTALLVTAAIAAPAAQAAQSAQATQTAQTAQAAPAARATHTTHQIQAARGPAGVAALSAELANAANAAVLWSRGASVERPMGSITKVMTAYVVIEAGDLNRAITVPSGIIAYDNKYGASTAGLIPGEKYTAQQLLYALLIPSGCDAAYTLANAYGPGLSKFIAKMNATAKKLGLTRTHFTDPSGLPDPTETSTYSTASNLITLGRDATKLALFRTIVGLYTYHLAKSSTHAAHTWTNYNTLLRTYKGAIGIKTGQTDAAGACLLFEARRGSKTLIGVVLHSSSTNLDVAFSDATKILNWGFAQ